jgi:hypothetical protein
VAGDEERTVRGVRGLLVIVGLLAVALAGTVVSTRTDLVSATGNSITTPDTFAAYSSLKLDSTGNPVMAFSDWGGSYNLQILHCNDVNCSGGGEISSFPDTSVQGEFSSLTLDANGYPVVSYHDTTNIDLRILHCNDPNCTGDDESIESPDTAGAVGAWSSIAST